MEVIKYNINVGTDENPTVVPASMTYSEANLEIVKKEAYEGKYEIVDEIEGE